MFQFESLPFKINKKTYCVLSFFKAGMRYKFWASQFHSHMVQFWFDFLCSIYVSFHSCLIFSIQGENWQDYQGRMTLNEAEQLYPI